MKHLIVGIFCLLFVSELTQADFFDAQRLTYEPLMGSKWAKDNIGKLPYEHCEIIVHRKNIGFDDEESTRRPMYQRWNFLTAAESKIEDDAFSAALACYSDKLRLIFTVPFQLSDVSHDGLLASLLPSFERGGHIKVSHLDGKRLEDVRGKYLGFSCGASALLGAKFGIFKNPNGVQIRDVNHEYGVGITACRSEFDVSDRQPFWHDYFMHKTGIVLDDDPGTSFSNEFHFIPTPNEWYPLSQKLWSRDNKNAMTKRWEAANAAKFSRYIQNRNRPNVMSHEFIKIR